MIKSILFLLITILLTNCARLQFQEPKKNYTHLPPKCQHIIKGIKDNFFYNKKYNHYVLSDNVIPKLTAFYKATSAGQYISCFSLLHTDAIRDIFGKPSKETQKGLYYYLDNAPEGNIRTVLIFFKDTHRREPERIYIGKAPVE